MEQICSGLFSVWKKLGKFSTFPHFHRTFCWKANETTMVIYDDGQGEVVESMDTSTIDSRDVESLRMYLFCVSTY